MYLACLRDSDLKFINCGVRLQIHISTPFTNELEVWLLHSLFNISYFHVQQLTAFKMKTEIYWHLWEITMTLYVVVY